VVFGVTLFQKLEHEICMSYRAIWVVPMQGDYQGNGGGPTIWAVVSSPLLQIMKKEGFDTFFIASITNGSVHIVGYAFVENTGFIPMGNMDQNQAWMSCSRCKMGSTYEKVLSAQLAEQVKSLKVLDCTNTNV
jgi:hypothetical protein